MLYWECKRRLESLGEFQKLVITYFTNITYQGWPSDEPILGETAQRARIEINRRLGDVQYSCRLVGVTCIVYYSPPPAIGGLAGQVDLLANIFELHQFRIPHTRVVDFLDRAIGNYQKRADWLFKQIFNPLFWAKWLLGKVIAVPFGLLGLAGFDADKIEESLGGKLIKAVVGFVVFLSALLAVLDYLGLLERFKALIGF